MRSAKSLLYSQSFAPFLFVWPFVITFLLFFAYPVISTVIMSFQQVVPGEVRFIGLDNYQKLWNPQFQQALKVSTMYTFWTLLVLIPVPLVLAVFLNSKLLFARNVFRSVLFVPALTSVVVAGVIFRLIFGETEGSVMNTIVGWFGIPAQKWLFNSTTGMLVLVLLASWRWMGINIIYFLSALQNIPKELYESADIDGAGVFQKFWSITLPLLKPITIYVLTISIYGGFAMFTESYVFWTNNSPGDIGLTIVGYLYKQGFEFFDLGYGSTIGITLLGLILIINVIQLKFFGLFRKES
ncbi:sugar ABC transporter permease [Paenibacillus sp.]|uniref:carbohydrate ABC transporter permease n=1 Tax=Paenibacillus sp. TaxID=58172 RepID=UPI002D4DAEE3|nr:sugar ABC transporter permease [Paenibacillus sp.]HZG86011.1 sugar ABC transporter permease [Paenibacillus sp.]